MFLLKFEGVPFQNVPLLQLVNAAAQTNARLAFP